MISGGTAPSILKQLMEISGQLHTPATLTLVAVDRSWVGSTAGLYAAEKKKYLAPISNCTQPVA